MDPSDPEHRELLRILGVVEEDEGDDNTREREEKKEPARDPVDEFIYMAYQSHPSLRHSKVQHSILRDVACQILSTDTTSPSKMDERAKSQFASAILSMGFDGRETENQRLARLEQAFTQQNQKSFTNATWDFHRLRVNEACAILESNLRALNHIPGRKCIKIITGRGLHGNNAFSVLEREISKRIQDMITKERNLVQEMRKESVGDMIIEVKCPSPLRLINHFFPSPESHPSF